MTTHHTSGAADPDALINIAREIEALKRECGMDPESPIAIQNGRYMALSYKVRALAAGQAVAPADGWLQDGGLLYRLTDERHPCNRDEINVTMADGSRSLEERAKRAGELLNCIRARPAPPAMDGGEDALEAAAQLLESQHTWITNVAAANLVRSLAARAAQKEGATT